MREGLHVKRMLVIFPIDSFTEKAIMRPDFFVTAEGEGRPVRKKEGFWVFVNLTKTKILVNLRGNFYQKATLEVDVSALDVKNPVVRVRMLPDRNYPFPKGTAYMEGMLPENSSLTAVALWRAFNARLLLDYRQGDTEITVYQEKEADLTGMVFCLTDSGHSGRDWPETEEFVRSEKQKAVYKLAAPAACDFRKTEALLYKGIRYCSSVYPVSYFIALPAEQGSGEFPVICCLDKAGVKTEYEIKLEPDNTLHRDFQ